MARKLSYTLPATNFNADPHSPTTVSMLSQDTPYPHFYFSLNDGLSNNTALFPDLDQWERHFVNLMKDIVAPYPLDKFLIGPSFHETHHRSFVQNLLRPTPTLKHATVACAAVLLGDQYAQYNKASVEIGHRRAALAVSGLRSLQISQDQDLITAVGIGVAMVTFAMHVTHGQSFLISRYTLSLVKPMYPRLLTMESGTDTMDYLMCLVSTETLDCLLKSEIPTIRIGEDDRNNVVDRYVGLSSGLFAHLYDICEVASILRHTSGKMDIGIVKQLKTTQDCLDQWQPSPPPEFLEKFNQDEVVRMLAQTEVLRLAALLIIHRLKHPFGQHDEEALLLCRAITAEFDMVLQVTGRSIPCTALAYMVASFEITSAEEQSATITKCDKMVNFSLQSQVRVKNIMYSVWNARSFGDQIHWFDLGDYIGKAETK
jgi:hypothetical protein